jgi:hypothetical protein
MTAEALNLIDRLASIGMHVLSYKSGILYIAGVGFRDTEWALRVLRRRAA